MNTEQCRSGKSAFRQESIRVDLCSLLAELTKNFFPERFLFYGLLVTGRERVRAPRHVEAKC
jgi:hypothetical protein